MSGKKNNAEKLSGRIITLLHSFSLIEEKERAVFQLLLEASGYDALKTLDVSLSDGQIASYLLDAVPTNTTRLAKRLGMTKGGVSKSTARMAGKKLLTVKRLPDNQKEVYYELTVLGEQLAYIYREMLRREEKRLGKFIAEYGNKQLEANLKLLGDLLKFIESRKK